MKNKKIKIIDFIQVVLWITFSFLILIMLSSFLIFYMSHTQLVIIRIILIILIIFFILSYIIWLPRVLEVIQIKIKRINLGEK